MRFPPARPRARYSQRELIAQVYVVFNEDLTAQSERSQQSLARGTRLMGRAKPCSRLPLVGTEATLRDVRDLNDIGREADIGRDNRDFAL